LECNGDDILGRNWLDFGSIFDPLWDFIEID